MSKRVKCTIGTDPEFFIRNSGRFISAIPHIKGTKHKPAPLPSGGTVQRDNVAVEFATPPAKDGKDFVAKVKACMKDVISLVPKDHELVVEPSADFDEDQLDHPEALEFGCDPDFNAYTVEQNEKPWCGTSGFRSCGAHIHVGGLDNKGKAIPGLEFLLNFQGKLNMVKAMDLFHGTVSTVLDNSKAAIRRRELYGKAGCHRPTEYGVEYRVLSNYWMKTPGLVMLMDSMVRDAAAVVSSGKLGKILNVVGETELQNMINEGNVKLAQKTINNHVKPHMSIETIDLFEMCLEALPKVKSLQAEWGI
jgi:hypothetical protein